MVLPDLVPICREQHFRRRFIPVIGAAAAMLALTIEVDSRKSALQVESDGFKIVGAVGVSVIDPAREAER